MAATDLTTLQLPPGCAEWATTADPQKWIYDHAVTVNLTWWNTSLTARGLTGGPVGGRTRTGEITDTGRATITRGALFALAETAQNSPTDTLRLLWHTLAWGAGSKVRLMHKRMNAIALAPSAAALGLQAAIQKSSTDPRAAFETLNPHQSPLLPHLGPAFFTKYLYAAGAGRAAHPCLILDARVAASLHRAGWHSLGTSRWPAATYTRYCELLARWGRENEVRPDLIERWLFETAGASSNPTSHGSRRRSRADDHVAFIHGPRLPKTQTRRKLDSRWSTPEGREGRPDT